MDGISNRNRIILDIKNILDIKRKFKANLLIILSEIDENIL